MRHFVVIFLFSILTNFTAIAQEVSVGDLLLKNPIARATPPGAKVGGGYILITNNGTTPDKLIGGLAPFAGKIEIHEMKVSDGIMRMKHMESGLTIPPGETVHLIPGGYHIMFMQLKQALIKGANHKVTLSFEKAGNVDITFNIKSIGETLKLRKKMKMKAEE